MNTYICAHRERKGFQFLDLFLESHDSRLFDITAKFNIL